MMLIVLFVFAFVVSSMTPMKKATASVYCGGDINIPRYGDVPCSEVPYVDSPYGLTYDPISDSFYGTETLGNRIFAISRLTDTYKIVIGVIDTAGTADGAFTTATLTLPLGIALEESEIFFSQSGVNTIRVANTVTQQVQVFAGKADVQDPVFDVLRNESQFGSPTFLTVYSHKLYASDKANGLIFRISLSSSIVSKMSNVENPYGLVGRKGILYIVSEGTTKQIVKMDVYSATVTVVRTLAGSSPRGLWYDVPRGELLWTQTGSVQALDMTALSLSNVIPSSFRSVGNVRAIAMWENNVVFSDSSYNHLVAVGRGPPTNNDKPENFRSRTKSTISVEDVTREKSGTKSETYSRVSISKENSFPFVSKTKTVNKFTNERDLSVSSSKDRFTLTLMTETNVDRLSVSSSKERFTLTLMTGTKFDREPTRSRTTSLTSSRSRYPRTPSIGPDDLITRTFYTEPTNNRSRTKEILSNSLSWSQRSDRQTLSHTGSSSRTQNVQTLTVSPTNTRSEDTQTNKYWSFSTSRSRNERSVSVVSQSVLEQTSTPTSSLSRSHTRTRSATKSRTMTEIKSPSLRNTVSRTFQKKLTSSDSGSKVMKNTRTVSGTKNQESSTITSTKSHSSSASRSRDKKFSKTFSPSTSVSLTSSKSRDKRLSISASLSLSKSTTITNFSVTMWDHNNTILGELVTQSSTNTNDKMNRDSVTGTMTISIPTQTVIVPPPPLPPSSTLHVVDALVGISGLLGILGIPKPFMDAQLIAGVVHLKGCQHERYENYEKSFTQVVLAPMKSLVDPVIGNLVICFSVLLLTYIPFRFTGFWFVCSSLLIGTLSQAIHVITSTDTSKVPLLQLILTWFSVVYFGFLYPSWIIIWHLWNKSNFEFRGYGFETSWALPRGCWGPPGMLRYYGGIVIENDNRSYKIALFFPVVLSVLCSVLFGVASLVSCQALHAILGVVFLLLSVPTLLLKLNRWWVQIISSAVSYLCLGLFCGLEALELESVDARTAQEAMLVICGCVVIISSSCNFCIHVYEWFFVSTWEECKLSHMEETCLENVSVFELTEKPRMMPTSPYDYDDDETNEEEEEDTKDVENSERTTSNLLSALVPIPVGESSHTSLRQKVLEAVHGSYGLPISGDIKGKRKLDSTSPSIFEATLARNGGFEML